MLTIHNSLSGEKEVFKPIHPNKINMYVCGVTVYDFCHLGHARMLVAFDTVLRYLRFSGYEVNYIRNITDIDDKIIKRAQENNESVKELTTRFIEAAHEDEGALNILPPDHEPLATDHMPQMITMIQQLIDKGAAYVADNGDVYYDVKAFKDYGKLANKDIESLQIGVRIDPNDAKLNPLDFVLWKMAKPGEPSWESPWGAGRPGWHIECSAMSTQCLGNHFDIHGGGHDLKFPHHENEIAQSEAATGETFVNYWMHNGFVQVNKEKMSKSLGNFFTIRDVLKEYRAEVVRYLLVASHYRSPIHYSDEALDVAEGSLGRLYTSLRDFDEVEVDDAVGKEFQQQFSEAMDDDFNTPQALAVLFNISHEINRIKTENPDTAAKLGARLRQLGQVLGIMQTTPEVFLQKASESLDVDAIEQLILDRKQARADKDWIRADEIRETLSAMGVTLEDNAEGTSWRSSNS